MPDPAPHTNRIGPYPIEREIGRGGMGIVYLGRDTRLDRPVAIKVLPEAFASDPDRLARFEREARLLASLSHPNIAAIYGLEESSGRRFLVLEYVEGETLAQRLAHGPLPVDDAIDVCRQIAAALEAAHEGGVVHRDLKPGNVKLTPAGDVKVLDFGLAKGGTSSGAGSDPSLSASPTLAVSGATGAGVILGTAAYMSPEQARGRSLDRRTDIWSFGCVLYECLTGRQAFSGETVSDMIALILQGEPDWKALPASTPPRLRELLARCLTKDAKKRLRDIGEARLVLEGGEMSGASGAFATAANAPRRAGKLAPALAALFALTTAALGGMLVMRSPEPAPVRRTEIEAPPTPYAPRDAVYPAISPDGSMLASNAADSLGGSRIWLRRLDQVEGRFLPGTEDVGLLFWSPDGRYLAFSTQDKLKKLDLRGGSPEVLGPITSYGRGGSWGSRGTIVYSAGGQGPIYRISAQGGAPEPATTLGPGETGHRFPLFLPDGRHFLYAALPPKGPNLEIYVGRIDDAKWRERLMAADGLPRYVEPGWLLYTRNDRVLAQRFDAGSRRLSGEPITLADEPTPSTFIGSSWIVAGVRGPFAYYRRQPDNVRIEWLLRDSRESEPLAVPPGRYDAIAVSPRGDQAVISRAVSTRESDLWLLDLQSSSLTRFTIGAGRVDRPLWSRDGRHIVFSSQREGPWNIYLKPADGGGKEQPVVEGGSLIKYADCFTPDGRTLIFEQLGEKTGWDLYRVDLDGNRTPEPLIATPADDQYADLSPDGKWLVYASNESGRNEAYVMSYPGLGGRRQISKAGAVFPRWRADGRELFFVTADGAAYVGFDPATGQTIGTVRVYPGPTDVISGAPAPNLERTLILTRDVNSGGGNALTLVDQWRNELRRK